MLKNLIYIVSFTAFVTLVWIFLGIYHNITSTTISNTTATQIDPISSSFDTQAITDLEKRTSVSSDLSGNVVFPTIAPSFPLIGTRSAQGPTPTAIPTPTVINTPVF